MVEYLEEIKRLEDELAKTAYNKRTQMHVGLVKAKIAKLKEVQVKRSGGKKGEGYSVKKSGDATVILVGFPSVGKSTILNAITNANSEVGSYEFTTLDVIPGTLNYKHAKIQVLDVPGIVHGAAMGVGRGKEVLAVIRNADLAIIIIDATRPLHYDALMKEMYDSGLRLNVDVPIIKIIRKPRGGISIGTTVKLTKIDKKTIEAIFKEFRINNADIVIRSDIDADQLIDAIEGGKIYIPALTVLNKVDLVSKHELERLKKELKPDICMNANEKVDYQQKLSELVFQKLKFICIYCKEVGKEADLNVPMIMLLGSKIKDLCTKLHKDFITNFKFARIWGPSAKFGGQKQMLEHKMMDGDIVEVHVR